MTTKKLDINKVYKWMVLQNIALFIIFTTILFKLEGNLKWWAIVPILFISYYNKEEVEK